MYDEYNKSTLVLCRCIVKNDRRVAVLRVFLKRTGTMENIHFWDILKANTKNEEDHT